MSDASGEKDSVNHVTHDGHNDTNWMMSTIFLLLVVGGGLVGLLSYFGPQSNHRSTSQSHVAPTPTVSDTPQPATELESSPPPPLNTEYLTGQWFSADGMTYHVIQQGDRVVFQEFHPMYGITASGEGKINENEVYITYRLEDGTMGDGDLTISPDGRQLVGGVTSRVTGVLSPLLLSR